MERNGTLVQNKYMEYLGSTLAYSLSIYMATIVDGILVGQLIGPESFAAINLTMPVVYVKNIVFMLFISGGSIMAAQFFGERRQADSNKIFTLSIFGCALGYAMLLILGIILSSPISMVLSQGGASHQAVSDYLIPLLASGIVMAFSNGAASFVRLDNRHKLATAVPIVANVINLCCDYIYIKFFHWGIAGAGWATVTGYFCSLVLYVPYLRDNTRNLHFCKVGIKDFGMLSECFVVGLPMALIQACNVLKNYILNSMVLEQYSDVGSQVIAVCNNALFYAMMFAEGASTAMASVCGILFGEKDHKGVVSVIRRAFLITIGLCAVVFVLLFIFPVEFGLFYKLEDPVTQEMLVKYMSRFILCIPLLAPIYVLRSYYQATKKTGAATAISIMDGAAITVPVLVVLYVIDRDSIWFANSIGSAITLIIIFVFMSVKARRDGYANLLMIPTEKVSKSYDFSIDNSEADAVKASAETIEFLKKNGIDERMSNGLGIAAEELCVNISKYAQLKEGSQIDLFIRILDNGVLLKVRDNGIMFNPSEYIGETGEKTTGISLIRALGSEITYDRVLGLNTTIITIPYIDRRKVKPA